MAQLPPKIPPSLTSNWPDFINPHHNKLFALNNLPPTANPSWVDEFLDFSSSRRDTHRRSISDSDIAFEKLDDEQFLSMFAEEKPSRPSHTLLYPKSNSSHENTVKEEERSSFMDEDNQLPRPLELKTEPEEVQSPCESDTEACPREGSTVKSMETTTDSGDKITDPKRVKRILANRQSAQRSRVRKLQYLSDLERSVTSLQAKVSVLSPRVAFLDHHRLLLNVDNSALKQRIAALAQDRIFKDAHHEALKKEIDRLKQVYEQQQNSKNIENSNATATASPDPSSESEAAH